MASTKNAAGIKGQQNAMISQRRKQLPLNAVTSFSNACYQVGTGESRTVASASYNETRYANR